MSSLPAIYRNQRLFFQSHSISTLLSEYYLETPQSTLPENQPDWSHCLHAIKR